MSSWAQARLIDEEEDEIRIHLVDVLLGGARRLFEELPHRSELKQTALS